MKKIYFLDEGIEGHSLLGNKGSNLVTMTRLGLPVPPGFVLSLAAFRHFQKTGKLPVRAIRAALSLLEKKAGRALGQGLTVSVRSSGEVSMPGMMDTLLNVASQEEVVAAVEQVFRSWDNPRAVEYRKLNQIPGDQGTATIVQAMVLGNRNANSGTGVVFTRNPNTGATGLFGEYLPQAQGEDLVSGRANPGPVDLLRSQMPQVYSQLDEMGRALEGHFREIQDIEFTVDDGRLFILQTRTGKRSGPAAVKIAVDMGRQGLISREEAILRVTPDDVRALLYKRLQDPHLHTPLAKGLAAAPGAACGVVVFDPGEAVRRAKKNEKIVLVRPETNPDDILGIAAAEAVLTSRGGLTSHAAIVTRAMGKACVCGCEALEIDLARQQFSVNGQVVKKGDPITVDGSSGHVYRGCLPLAESEMIEEFQELMAWASESKTLGVWANADTAEMIATAKRFGAEGIGLCRTERQFNGPERLAAIRSFILAENPQEKAQALQRLEALQREDFVAIFRDLQGTPIIIRLLDLPLHEFLPREEEVQDPSLLARIRELREVNPMLGHRGVRLGITSPEVYQMQLRAISQALDQVPARVSVMVPQVITVQELLAVKKYVTDPRLKLGVMMETVRACMRAGTLAREADFFSFGTNDLSQATFSFSREDVEKKFLTTYLETGILQDNPFEVVDVKGVGRLMEIAIHWARKEKKDLAVGVCGEHGGEPRSIRFFQQVGVSYVSVSPYKLPVARLAAAQAAIEARRRTRPKPSLAGVA